MTSLVNSATWSIGTGAGTFTLSFDAGSTANRVLHVFIAETAAAGDATLTYNGVSLTRQTGAGTSDGLWELIAPASGTNTLSITYGANAATHAAWVWCVDGVNQEIPWTVGIPTFFSGGANTPLTTSPITADSTQTCVTLEVTNSTDTVTANDGSLTTTSLVYGTKKLWSGYKQGAGAAFVCSWSVNSVTTAASYAIIYRPAGVALASGWYGIVQNGNQEGGANTRNLGSESIVPVASAVQFTKISSNNGATQAAIDAAGNLYTWGTDRGTGMLGDGSIHAFQDGEIATPTAVSGVTTAVDVCVGNLETVFVKGDGTAWYFGRDVTDGTFSINHTSATQISGLSNIVRVAAGDEAILALDSSGVLYFIGDNSFGLAANGAHSGIVTTPFTLSLTNVVDFAMSEAHAIACDSAGAVYCWGSNAGQCTGQGVTTGFTTSPAAVSGPSNVIHVAALDDPCSLVVTSAGNVWFWGGNTFGERGNGTTGGNFAPVQVTMPGGETYTALASNFLSFEVYVLTASKKVYGWGLNPFGAIGRNFFVDVLSPTLIYPSLVAGVTAMCNVGDDGIFFLVRPPVRSRVWCALIG